MRLNYSLPMIHFPWINQLAEFERITLRKSDGQTFLVPSDMMLIEVIRTLSNQIQLSFLVKNSNDFVENQILNIRYLRPDPRVLCWDQVAKLTGHSEADMRRALIIESWYEAIESSRSSLRNSYEDQRLSKKIFSKLTAANKEEEWNLVDQELSQLKPGRESRFTERKSAQIFITSVYYIASLLVRDPNSPLKKILQFLDEHSDRVTLKNMQSNKKDIVSCQCQYCGTIYQYTTGKGVNLKPHCGNRKCEREYRKTMPSRQSKTKEFQNLLEINKISPQSEWKRGRCDGFSCLFTRLLETKSHLCNECLQEYLKNKEGFLFKVKGSSTQSEIREINWN